MHLLDEHGEDAGADNSCEQDCGNPDHVVVPGMTARCEEVTLGARLISLVARFQQVAFHGTLGRTEAPNVHLLVQS